MGMGMIKKIVALMLSQGIKALSNNRLLILNYHRVFKTDDVFFNCDLEQREFSWQMQLLSKYLNPVSLDTAISLMKNNKLPPGSIAVTFDDGYKDNIEKALPILKKYQVPATFYIATAFLNDGIMWNDIIIESIKNTENKEIDLSFLGLGCLPLENKGQKIQTIEKCIKKIKYNVIKKRIDLAMQINKQCNVVLPKNLMMSDNDIFQLAKEPDMKIGAHTHNHPILACETDEFVYSDIKYGKDYLERLLNCKLSSFAYPNGKKETDYQERNIETLKKVGFNYAVTTNWGLNNKKSELLELKRFTPWDRTQLKFLTRILKLYALNKI